MSETRSPATAPPPPISSDVPLPWWTGPVCGLAAGAAGIGIAELVAGFGESLRSPVISVGDRVVDAVPTPIKDWAISTFGTSDKLVLLSVVAVLLACFAAGIGVLAVRRGRTAGLVGVAVFALVGAAASVGRGGSGIISIVPSLHGGLAAAAALVVLLQRAGLEPTPSASPDTATMGTASMGTASRRRFLGTAAAITAGAVAVGGAGRWLQQQAVTTAQRLKIVLPTPKRPLAAPPDGVDVGVEGVSTFFTPNDDFYRIDTALAVPRVDVETWTLSVGGGVERPITMTFSELLERPMVEADITLSCVSNEVGGSLVGNARWLGCRLDDLLEEAGIDPAMDQVLSRSVDGFTAGFPTALLDGRDALIAVGMNGSPLPIDHGFPARLVVPGVYGYVSATKWLSEIELTTFDAERGYWIPRGWATEAPVKTQSRIDTPRDGAQVAAGEPTAIAGVAWAPIRGIERVEVRVDEQDWRDARLGESYEATTWRQWALEWTPTPGAHRIQVRATDGDGVTQTEVPSPVAPDGATGWHSIDVRAD